MTVIVPGRVAPYAPSDLAAEDGLLADGGNNKGIWRYESGAAVLQESPQYDRDMAQTGIIAPMPLMGGTTTTTLTAQRLLYGRFVASRAMALTKVAICTTTAASVNDPIEIAIFDSAGTRIGTTGAVSGVANATAGVQTMSFTGTINLAVRTAYYVAILQTTIGGTAAAFHAISFSNNNAADLFGATLGTRAMAFLSGQASMPASGLGAGTTQQSMPLFALRES